MSGLTPQQARVLSFVRDFVALHGWSPAYSEIGAHLGGLSRSSVHRLIGELEIRGQVRRLPGKARGIEVIMPRTVELNPEIYALIYAYAQKNSTSVKTATNEALRSWLGAAA